MLNLRFFAKGLTFLFSHLFQNLVSEVVVVNAWHFFRDFSRIGLHELPQCIVARSDQTLQIVSAFSFDLEFIVE